MSYTVRDELEQIINSHYKILDTPPKSDTYSNISSTLNMHEELILRLADKIEGLKD